MDRGTTFLSAIRSWRQLLSRAAPITLRPRDACTRSSCDLAPLRRHGSVLLRFCRLLVHGAARQCCGPNDPSGFSLFLHVCDAICQHRQPRARMSSAIAVPLSHAASTREPMHRPPTRNKAASALRRKGRPSACVTRASRQRRATACVTS